jgi:hypothetical protein
MPLQKGPFDETPEAGEEWIAKAMLLNANLELDSSVWGVLWGASAPGSPKRYFGVTPARACRKFVRSITGVE